MNQNRPNLFVAVFALAFLGAASVAQAQEVWCYAPEDEFTSYVPFCFGQNPYQTAHEACVANRDSDLRSETLDFSLCAPLHRRPYCFSWLNSISAGVSCTTTSRGCNLLRDAVVRRFNPAASSCSSMGSRQLEEITNATEEARAQMQSARASRVAQELEIQEQTAQIQAANVCITRMRDFLVQFAIQPRHFATQAAYVADLTSQIDAGKQRLVGLLRCVPANYYPRAPQEVTVDVLVAQGLVIEKLVQAILDAPLDISDDMKQQLAGLSPESRDHVLDTVSSQIAAVLNSAVGQTECLSVRFYALALSIASPTHLENNATRFATERLNAYGEERVAACSTAT